MSCETRSRAKSHKRDRPIIFDANRSVVIVNKKKRDNSDETMAEGNPGGDGQIRDLSQTINVSSPVSNSIGPVFLQGGTGETRQNQEPAGFSFRTNELGQRLIENKIQTLQNEMLEIKESLLVLTNTLKESHNGVENPEDTLSSIGLPRVAHLWSPQIRRYLRVRVR